MEGIAVDSTITASVKT